MSPSLRNNPFFELYVGERVTDEEFVRIFSPVLVKHSEAMFSPGNVVVTGIQGSGKSMLLSLLKTDVRIAYHRSKQELPVTERLRGFIGAGINLAHSNAIDFGIRRMPGVADGPDDHETALYFGDFVNYGICLDLLGTLEKVANDPALAKRLGVDLSEVTITSFIRALKSDRSWHGYLANVSDWASLKERLSTRLQAYRDYLHYNSNSIDEKIGRTKTSIGVPISGLIRMLKRESVVKSSVHLFIYIDQYEELANLKRSDSSEVDNFRKLINKALARRDPNVSYRIGARSHAWAQGTEIFGSRGRVEEERDYKLIDLDSLLKRPENRKSWIFPAFAADVFSRRLAHDGDSRGNRTAPAQKLLQYTFGNGLSAEKRGEDYAGANQDRAARAVRVDKDWPAPIREFLLDLARTNPLSARLGEAWYLQRHRRPDFEVDDFLKRPWDSLPAQWWKKERIEQALFQIAGRCQQRLVWTGANDIVELSGGNILIFISLCQHIWSAYLRVVDEHAVEDLTSIDDHVQALGIFQASTHWVRKINEGTGHSGDRGRFVRWLAEHISSTLNKDRSLSYPGHNGFSIAVEELEAKPHVRTFLSELVDYGSLIEGAHVTKEKDRRTRLKWYLNPVYSPHYRIPYKRLKEPEYVSVRDVETWLSLARVESIAPSHGILFDWIAESEESSKTVSRAV